MASLGWTLDRVSGSHHIYKHPRGARPVNVCRNGNNRDFGAKLMVKINRDIEQSLELYKQYQANRSMGNNTAKVS